MRKKKEKKIIKTIKVISVVLVIILFFELSYLLYIKCFDRGKSIYFDSINAIQVFDGKYFTVGSNNNNSSYFEKAKVSFYDENKLKILEKIYNKGYNSAFFDLDVLNDEVIAVGSYEATEEEHDSSHRRALIVKYDTLGNVIFDKDFKVLENSKFMAVKGIDDGYLVVGQSIYDEMSLGASSEGGAFIIKYDKNGNVEWTTNYGDSKSSTFNDLYVSNDYIYVVGNVLAETGVLVKFDLNGNFIEEAKYEFTDEFGFTGITSNGNELFVSGGKRNVIDGSKSTDGLLVKYDFNCKYLTDEVFDNGENERFNKVVVDENGDLVVVGSMTSYDNEKINKDVNALRYDGLIAKYKGDLKLVKSVFYGEDMDDHFTDVLVYDNKYLISGYSSYGDNSYMSKFIIYSDALKVLEVQ